MKLMAGPGEGLLEHLKDVGEKCREISEKLRINSPRLAYFAGILHDTGKSLSFYQLRAGKGPAYFPAHEIFSALIACHVLPELGLYKSDLGEVVYAVLMHHQAISTVRERLSKLHLKRRDWSKSWNLEKSEKALALCTKDLLLGKSSSLARKVVDDIDQWIKGGVKEGKTVSLPISQALRTLTSTEHVYKARILTGVVMVADTLVAMKARGGGATSIYRKEVLRLAKTLDLDP